MKTGIINLNNAELKSAIKVGVITALFTLAASKAFAVNCDDHKSCFSKSLALIKQTVKLSEKSGKSFCVPEIKALASEIGDKAQVGSPRYEALETCLTVAKGDAKRIKGKAKEIERLNKALKGDS